MRSLLARLALLGRLVCALAVLGTTPMVRAAVPDVAAEHAPAPPRRPVRPPLPGAWAAKPAPIAPASPREPRPRVRRAAGTAALRWPPRHSAGRHAPVYLANRALLL